MRIRKQIILLSMIAAVATGASCGGSHAANEQVVAETGSKVIPNVDIVRVGKSSIAETYEATGTVKAVRTTQVSANLLGRINAISVDEGDQVSRGQVLVQIDDRDAQNSIQKAQAGLTEARASLVEVDDSSAAADAAIRTAEANKQLADTTLGRYRELYRRKSVSGQEFDEVSSRSNAAASELDRAKAIAMGVISKKTQIKARIRQAEADVANSRVYASYAHILSPVSGIVVKKFAEPGGTAAPGVPLLAIDDNSKFRLEVSVGESHSNLIHMGERVPVRIDALGTEEIIGAVAEILPTSDAASRSFIAKIDLPHSPLLRTGFFGIARFTLSAREAITVEEGAIVRRGQLIGVYVVGPDGSIRFRLITTGKSTRGSIEVLSGLSEGDEIATNIEKLHDGAKVR